MASLRAGTITTVVVNRGCEAAARSSSMALGNSRRFTVVVAMAGMRTYGVLYAVTTLLGRLAS